MKFVASDTPAVIGKVYRGVCNAAMKFFPEQPVMIIRPATRAEWEADCRENGGNGDAYPYRYYYHVSTD